MTEEAAPVSPESTSPMPAPAATGLPAAAPAARRRGGFLGRVLAALLVIVITVFLALVAVAVGLLSAGYTLQTPQQLGLAQQQLATLQAQSQALQQQSNTLQTQVAAQEQRGGTDHEVLSDLKAQLANIAALRDQLRQEREQSASQNATLVAEARSSRDAVALFATAEASRAALLADLERRSARIERFLQRLSDISSDTALDLGAATAPAQPTLPAPTIISELSPTPTSVPTLTPTATANPTETSSPTPSPTATATPRAPTATPRTTRSATPASESPTATP